MNKLFWILTISISLIGMFFLIVSFTNKNIETPDYKIIKKIEDIELRRYPNMLVAKTNLSDKSFDNQGNVGFRTIAGYIFGGNEKNEKIAMTAPVVMNIGENPSMYFVMPKKYREEDLPQPNSKNVQIVNESSKTLAVISFGGYSSDEKIKNHVQKLSSILKKNQVASKGDFMFMGYNAPWDVFNRKNEVAIEVILD
jgi:hypothetical protein